ncbi:MAG: hypothetical protein KGI59_02220 [Patescibacteria group bacterium]|nr:hypothetical protein [Patescibacteria group bacterium]MDE2172435.1 hypothetical protein [Patescibacteria group bacterium]
MTVRNSVKYPVYYGHIHNHFARIMLSVFPYMLSFTRLGPTLVRLGLAAVFLFWTYRSLRGRASTNARLIGLFEGVVGGLILIGLWTQVAALLAAVDLIIRIVGRVRNRAFLTDGVNYYVLLLLIALSLVVTGPGFFAFDLPL